MAPFNKRQIGYIQAVAGRQQHTTLKCGNFDRQLNSRKDATLDVNNTASYTAAAIKIPNMRKATGGSCFSTESDAPDAKSLFIQNYNLDKAELCFDARDVHNNNLLEAADFSTLFGSWTGFGSTTELHCFNATCRTKTDSTTVKEGGVTKFDVNDDIINSTERATSDGYLHSTNVTFRFTLPTNAAGTQVGGNETGNTSLALSSLFPTADELGITNTNSSLGITRDQYEHFIAGGNLHGEVVGDLNADLAAIQSLINQYNAKHTMGQDHYEFRWIVWRSKNPTFSRLGDDTDGNSNLEAIRNGCSFRNPGYDLFVGQTGRKRGFMGYTHHPKLDHFRDPDNNPSERYSGYVTTQNHTWSNTGHTYTQDHPDGEQPFTVDDLLTCRLNRDDYVIMKDVRFFLGKEHGKSHFEDTLHWDWNDPIDTPHENVLSSPTLNNKNFRWHMTLIGTSGGRNPVVLNESVRWTTKMTSG